MNKTEKVIEFAKNLKVTKNREESYRELMLRLYNTLSLRSINCNDSFKSHYMVLVIESVGSYFKSWAIKYADFNHVSGKYAEAYIYDNDGDGKPTRVDIDSEKVSVIIY